MDAAFFRDWMTVAAAIVETQRDHLTQLDAAIGDADHGINLARGFTAVLGAFAACLISRSLDRIPAGGEPICLS